MARRHGHHPSLLRGLAGLCLVLVAAVLAACGDGGDEPSTGAALTERWLRVGESQTANVQVLEGALPSGLRDLLNPDRTPDTPESDLVAFPVHPAGELLGSYLVRRESGEQIAWLFYDVPDETLSGVTGAIASQLDASPWQVIGQQGNRSFTVVRFESTRTTGMGGDAIIEVGPPAGAFALVVLRDGEEVTLDVTRDAPAPPVEAELDDSLEVLEVFPGLMRTAGLQEGDQIVRVGDTDVGTRRELQRALEAMASDVQTISVIYALNFTSPGDVTPPFVMPSGSSLPSGFPASGVWSGLTVDEYQTAVEPGGTLYAASLFSEDTPTAVSDRIRDGLDSDGWTIVSDEPSGTTTQIQFERTDDRLMGIAQVDASPLDDSLTQVFVQIQTAPPAGN